MRDVHRILTGDQTSVRLVLTPERVVIAESRRTWTSLSLYGFVVDAVVVNRVLPGGRGRRGQRPDAWRASWNAAQQDGLVEVRESFAGLPVVVTPYLPSEPIGADALADLAEAQEGGTDVLAPVTHRGLAVERTDEGFLLVLPLPLAHAADLGLQRRDDELVVTVGEHRRVLTLALGSATMRGRGCLRARRTAAGALRPRRGGLAAWLTTNALPWARWQRRLPASWTRWVAGRPAPRPGMPRGRLPTPTHPRTRRPCRRARPGRRAQPCRPARRRLGDAGASDAGADPGQSRCASCGAENGVGQAVACQLCPVCQGIGLLRSVRPETVDRLADLAGALAATLRDIAGQRRADAGTTAPRPPHSHSHPHSSRVHDIAVDDEDAPGSATS